MESQYSRSIKDGSQYDHLFPTPQGKHITILKDAEVNDTISLIKRTVPQTLKDTEKIAAFLKGKTLEETCSNIWHFVYAHIQYKKDETGIEQVRRPARTWWDRTSGVDCDCYTEFISSILTNLGIPHKLRITKYNGKSYFQHIYPIVPYDGNVTTSLTNRNNYITIDCVKNAFDDEQVFSGFKDYDMRLDYLNGLDDEYRMPENTDAGDLGSMEQDDELNGKVGNWIKSKSQNLSKGIRFINRFTNPGTILLRNGFLLAMKINFMHVAGKLRYAYLSDEQAKAMNIDLDSLYKLRKVKDKAESLYWQAGGKKENLKKAILGGKGNKNKQVPISGINDLDDEYVDQTEYNIIHNGNVNGIDEENELGDPATGASLVAATGAMSALAKVLSQIKGVFKKGTPQAQEFNQGSETSASTTSANSTTAESTETEDTNTSDEKTAPNSIQNPLAINRTTLLNRSIPSGVSNTNEQSMVTPSTTDTDTNGAPKTEGFLSKSATWVKENPGKSLLITSILVGGAFLLIKKDPPKSPINNQSLNGVPKRKKKSSSTKSNSKIRIRTIEI